MVFYSCATNTYLLFNADQKTMKAPEGQREAVLAALKLLGGTGTIAEVEKIAMNKWRMYIKSCGTVMADMVSLEHGGNKSSSVPEYLRILKRIGRGVYSISTDKKTIRKISDENSILKNRIEDHPQEQIFEDLKDIIHDPNIEATEKATLSKARIGQGEFRSRLIQLWGGKCSVTGFTETGLLVASHIKPWRESDNAERLSQFNGLLLTPNLDKAFDAGYITFDVTGNIRIFTEFGSPEKLCIFPDMKVKLSPGA